MTSHSHPSKFRLKWFIILIASIILGLSLIERAKTVTYNKASTGQKSPESLLLPAYEKKVKAKTDARKLAQVGQNLLDKQMPQFAVVNFKQAVAIDPEYRDAAYGWAYSLATIHQSDLNQETIDQINRALDKVEAVDPHYIPGLTLRQEIAQLEGKKETVDAMAKRIELLNR